jgi:hypothetical protein
MTVGTLAALEFLHGGFTMASLDWLARLGIVGPALPPLVPWQPAQAFDIIAGVGGAAWPSPILPGASGQRPSFPLHHH